MQSNANQQQTNQTTQQTNTKDAHSYVSDVEMVAAQKQRNRAFQEHQSQRGFTEKLSSPLPSPLPGPTIPRLDSPAAGTSPGPRTRAELQRRNITQAIERFGIH